MTVRRVLVVQDDDIAAGTLEDVLVELGYDVPETVISGEIEPKLEKQEKDLYMNPRRVR